MGDTFLVGLASFVVAALYFSVAFKFLAGVTFSVFLLSGVLLISLEKEVFSDWSSIGSFSFY